MSETKLMQDIREMTGLKLVPFHLDTVIPACETTLNFSSC